MGSALKVLIWVGARAIWVAKGVWVCKAVGGEGSCYAQACGDAWLLVQALLVCLRCVPRSVTGMWSRSTSCGHSHASRCDTAPHSTA